MIDKDLSEMTDQEISDMTHRVSKMDHEDPRVTPLLQVLGEMIPVELDVYDHSYVQYADSVERYIDKSLCRFEIQELIKIIREQNEKIRDLRKDFRMLQEFHTYLTPIFPPPNLSDPWASFCVAVVCECVYQKLAGFMTREEFYHDVLCGEDTVQST